MKLKLYYIFLLKYYIFINKINLKSAIYGNIYFTKYIHTYNSILFKKYNFIFNKNKNVFLKPNLFSKEPQYKLNKKISNKKISNKKTSQKFNSKINFNKIQKINFNSKDKPYKLSNFVDLKKKFFSNLIENRRLFKFYFFSEFSKR